MRIDPRKPEQNAYRSALARCQNAHHSDYANYGGRGIEFRFDSFDHFFKELGPRPSRKHSLDRFPDNDGHYEPGNVRWATMPDQGNNRRTNVLLSFRGQIYNVTQWAKGLGVPAIVLFKRKYRGWCDTCTISIANGGGACTHRVTSL